MIHILCNIYRTADESYGYISERGFDTAHVYKQLAASRAVPSRALLVYAYALKAFMKETEFKALEQHLTVRPVLQLFV